MQSFGRIVKNPFEIADGNSEIVNNTWHINRKDFEVKQR